MFEAKGTKGVPPNYKRNMFYRLSVWFLRLMPAAIAAFFIWPGFWFTLPALIVFGLSVTLPLRYTAYFDWGMSTSDLHAALLRDAVDTRFG